MANFRVDIWNSTPPPASTLTSFQEQVFFMMPLNDFRLTKLAVAFSRCRHCHPEMMLFSLPHQLLCKMFMQIFYFRENEKKMEVGSSFGLFFCGRSHVTEHIINNNNNDGNNKHWRHPDGPFPHRHPLRRVTEHHCHYRQQWALPPSTRDTKIPKPLCSHPREEEVVGEALFKYYEHVNLMAWKLVSSSIQMMGNGRLSFLSVCMCVCG